MAGIATLASTVGAPITHIRKLDDANATTGLVLSFKNDSGLACLLRVGYYIVTQATSDHTMDGDVVTAATTQGADVFSTHAAGSGTVHWSDGNIIIGDGEYFTLYNVSTHTPAVATALVGYAILQLWPVCTVT